MQVKLILIVVECVDKLGNLISNFVEIHETLQQITSREIYL